MGKGTTEQLIWAGITVGCNFVFKDTTVRQHCYVYCQAHCLNLVLVESAKANQQFVDFFTVVEKLFTFIANSPKCHAQFVETQRAINPDQCAQISRVSQTPGGATEKML